MVSHLVAYVSPGHEARRVLSSLGLCFAHRYDRELRSTLPVVTCAVAACSQPSMVVVDIRPIAV
jgi:hypothetical protein